MDNQQFRRLLINTHEPTNGKNSTPAATRPSATPALGSRKHSSIPMTPRQVGRSTVTTEFARQLAERNAKADPSKRKFRSAAPKGTKLAAGYIDRTKNRVDEEEDEKAQRIKNLEDVMKQGQIDRETFEKLVLEITGGDIGSTHLVKGLDRKLLERVRKGEDVLGSAKEDEMEEHDSEVEDVFDELAEKEVGPIVREKVEKKGQMAPPPPLSTGIKRSRDAILAQLKAERKAAAEAAAAEHEKKYPTLGEGFRKVTPRGETSRIEVDSRGRETLIITNADGKEKRKVRKQKIEAPALEIRNDIDNPKKPINMHNLPAPKLDGDSEEEDIFEGVGSTYNPLAALEDGDDDDSSSDEEGVTKPLTAATVESETSEEDESKPSADLATEEGDISSSIAQPKVSKSGEDSDEEPSKSSGPSLPLPSKQPPPPKRNYFNDTPSTVLPSTTSTADATVLAALKKVRALDADSTLLQTGEEARLKKRAAELANNDRDMEDMDMDFGGSRFDDATEMEREGEKVKFSEWRGLGAEEDEDEGGGKKGGAGQKRKRAPKKRKGDKNSAADVLQAMDRQKEKKMKTLG